MSNILSDLANSVGNAVKGFFQPKSSFIPTSQVTNAFNSAYSGNPRYDLQPNGSYVENSYGKTMDSLDQQQKAMQPAVNEANFVASMVDLGYNSPYYQKPGGAPAAFPYGPSLSAPPTATPTSYGVSENPNQPVDNSAIDAQALSSFWDSFKDQNPYDYFYPQSSPVDTSSFTNAASQIGQPTEAESWLKNYL